MTECVTLLKDICDQLSRPDSKDFLRCKNAGVLTGSIADIMSTILLKYSVQQYQSQEERFFNAY